MYQWKIVKSPSTIVFKKNGPTHGGYKCKFLREVHKSKLNAFESNAMLRCLFRFFDSHQFTRQSVLRGGVGKW